MLQWIAIYIKAESLAFVVLEFLVHPINVNETGNSSSIKCIVFIVAKCTCEIKRNIRSALLQNLMLQM